MIVYEITFYSDMVDLDEMNHPNEYFTSLRSANERFRQAKDAPAGTHPAQGADNAVAQSHGVRGTAYRDREVSAQ